MRRLLCLLAMLLFANPASAAIAVVHHTVCQAASGSSLICTVPTTAAGNALIAIVVEDGTRTVSSVKEGAASNFGAFPSAALAMTGTFATAGVDVWYVASANGGATTVTVTLTGAVSNIVEMEVWEISHTGTLSADGVTNLGAGGGACVGTDCTGASITTTGAVGFVVAWAGTNAGAIQQNPKAGNAFTSGGDIGATFPDGFVSLVTAAASTYTPVWTTNTSGDAFPSLTAAFKEAGGGAACTPTLTLLGVGRCG